MTCVLRARARVPCGDLMLISRIFFNRAAYPRCTTGRLIRDRGFSLLCHTRDLSMHMPRCMRLCARCADLTRRNEALKPRPFRHEVMHVAQPNSATNVLIDGAAIGAPLVARNGRSRVCVRSALRLVSSWKKRTMECFGSLARDSAAPRRGVPTRSPNLLLNLLYGIPYFIFDEKA